MRIAFKICIVLLMALAFITLFPPSRNAGTFLVVIAGFGAALTVL